MHKYKVVLASASPRRKQILNTIGLQPTIQAADIDETPYADESPEVYVERLAREKAQAIAHDHKSSLVIAGDTIVVLDEEILQKPISIEEAETMLVTLRNKVHRVLTGMALVDTKHDQVYSCFTETDVCMRNYDDSTIKKYIATGEPMDKAGSYGIQGIGSILVDEIKGDYNTVVGLSVRALIEGLHELNIDYFDLMD